MFTQLMNKEEKAKFLELVYKTATCDSDYAEEEQELVRSYQIELGMDEIPETASLEELIAYFAAKETTLKKAVLFELYGMILADDKIEAAEAQILELIDQHFALSKEAYDRLLEAARELQQAYDKVYSAIFD
ncbi:MAG: hypothetical protein LUD78_02205 [Clostridiales bacterium]|nr:hypothetical protein [Clostridiales bacterium]